MSNLNSKQQILAKMSLATAKEHGSVCKLHNEIDDLQRMLKASISLLSDSQLESLAENNGNNNEFFSINEWKNRQTASTVTAISA